MKKLSMLLVAVLILVGCSGNAKSDQENIIEIGVEKTYVPYMEEMKKGFEAENKDVKIKINEVEMIPFLDTLPNKKGNASDIFMIPNDRIGDLANQKLIVDFDVDVSKYTDTAQNAVSYKDLNYMVPMSTETTLLFYNGDVVSEVPKTLKEIPAKDFAANFTDFYMAAGMFYANGSYIFNNGDVNDIGLNNDNAIKAGKEIQALYNSGSDIWELGKDKTTAYAVMNDAFVSGQVKYMINGPWKIADFEKEGIKNLKVAPIPSWDGSEPYRPLVGTKGLVLNAYSDSTDKSIEFLKYIATKENAIKWFEMTKEVSPHIEVTYEAGSNAQIIFDATAAGAPMPTTPEMGKVWEPMANALAQIAIGEDVKASLDAAVATIKTDIAEMK
ncbi:MAG: sugar ABC transporter substrate-binding protein [Bacilli bacterium]